MTLSMLTEQGLDHHRCVFINHYIVLIKKKENLLLGALQRAPAALCFSFYYADRKLRIIKNCPE